MNAAAGLRCFDAATPQGVLRLAVPADTAEGDAVAAALLLSRCEGLIAALEAWCGAALDPVPASADAVVAGGVLAVAADDRLAPADTQLQLPLAWLQHAGPAPAELADGALAWPPLRFELELARFAESPLPASGRTRAGMLLLPGSFEPAWRVALRHRALGLALQATWQGPGTPLRLVDGAPAEGAGDWRVVADRPVALAPLQCCASPPAGAVELSAGELPVRLLAPHGTEPVAVGLAVPALRGTGVWLPATPRPAAPVEQPSTEAHAA